MTLLIAPADYAELLNGQPVLLALEQLPNATALALPGLRLWLVAAGEDAVRLYRPGGRASAATRPLPAVPGPVLGVVAPRQADAAALLAAWTALGPEAPALILAEDGPAALPALAGRAVAALAVASTETARLQRGLVATRQDYEATRTVVLALGQSIGHEIPPQPSLALHGEAGLGLAVGTTAGHLALGQVLGLPLDGLCGVALHLAEARLGPESRLRVRLYGVESGRVQGAWLLPGAALEVGWLRLDLTAPLGPLRETAALDISAELAPGEVLAFSQEDRLADAALAVQQRGAPAHGRALAVRAWTAPLGRRFALPLWWDAEQIDLPLPPEGVPVQLPAQAWAACRVPPGQGGLAALGDGPTRPLLRPAPGSEAMAVLPRVPTTGLDQLEASLAVLDGPAEGLEAALWLQPAGCTATAPGQLRLEAPAARFSGWRRLGERADRLSIGLRLPLGGADSVAVVLVLRRTAEARGACEVEWGDLVGRRMGRLPPPEGLPTPSAPPTLAAEPGFATARLQEHYATADGGYRHLDLLLERAYHGTTRWPALRFKLALNGTEPLLEFRRQADWPLMFEEWPGERSDEHGPVFRVAEDQAARLLADGMKTPRDARALRLVLLLLPEVLRRMELPAEAGDPALWRELAERLAATLPPA